jgi:polysaccharide export outer membrane protein
MMYSQGKAVKTRIFMLALIVLVGLCSISVFAQDTTTPAADQDNAAKPVLPDSTSAAPTEAKASPLPPSNTPSTRVPAVRPDTYIVGIGDVLQVLVWKEGDLSKTLAVRPDGMITLPLVGEIKAVGLTPSQLKEVVTTALEKVISDPQVTIMVESVQSMSFNMVGNVNRPGYYPLTRPVTILDAIALGGGFRDFAKQNKIYILRTGPNGTELKIKFNYKEVIKGKKMAQNVVLQPHDTLVIP